MQEEILINKIRTGTTAYFFNTDINENNYSISTVPAVVKVNSSESIPLELNAFDGISSIEKESTILWKRNDEKNLYDSGIRMNYVQENTTNKHNNITGRTFSQTFNSPISEIRVQSLRENFINSMNDKFSAGTTSYVFFQETLINDLYANIKLERTFGTLDTLNIYNKVTGEYSTRESTTGVVFGKLEAVQKLTDENGNKLRIPLRNVPIGIFVESEEFQSPNDLDKDGNRIRLNYRPLTSTEETYATGYTSYYFNLESSSFDNQFLKRTPLNGINIHPTFSNVVYTNENGEFILHNVTTGPQILFFEVDLLKQGLTKDEVALNYFPYPPNYENISIDTIPHYFYRAIPIDVVPSWGTTFQTGYTEVNISANLDLRKWATYIFPPVTYSGRTIDSPEYQSVSRAPLTVQIRDMSKYDIKKLSSGKSTLEVYPSKKIQVVEIQDIKNRNADQQWEWANEFSQIKDKVLFYNHGYHAIKLPANIYDDDGYKTNKLGEPQTNNPYLKGVWLCGYQLKMFLTNENKLYRTTGMALISSSNDTGWYDRDHFHCSLYDDIYALSVNESTYGSSLGWARGLDLMKFPYQKAWSKNYPEKYSIPKTPKTENFLRQNGTSYYFANGIDSTPRRPYIESPRYADGDLISGNSWLDPGFYDGWGLSWASAIEQYTDFATDVIGGVLSADMYRPDMYRYEPLGAEPYGQNQYFGCYANGYYNNIPDVGASSMVPNAERYQRIEAGYGYYLFPSSMPRIVPIPTGLNALSVNQVDIVSKPGIDKKGYSSTEDQTSDGWWNLIARVNHYNSYSVLNRGKNISMDLSKKTNIDIPDTLINDKLNIYRIVEGSQRVPYDTLQPVIPTYTCFKIEDFYFTKNDNVGDKVYPHHNWGFDSSEMDNYIVTLTVINTAPEKLSFSMYSEGDSNKQYILEPNESKVFYRASEPSSNTEYIWSSLRGVQIVARGNVNYDETNNKFLKTSLQFIISASWRGYGSGQALENLYIKDKCNITCNFDAVEAWDGNVFYANTIWRGTNVVYYSVDGNNGYANSNDPSTYHDYFNEIINIQGIFCNPGKYDTMYSYSDGNTTSTMRTSETGRLNGGGAMELYWSKRPRGNPNGVATWPVLAVSYSTNYNDYWESPLCGLHGTPSGLAYMTDPNY